MSGTATAVEIPGVGTAQVPAPGLERREFPNLYIPYEELVLKVAALEDTVTQLRMELEALKNE